MVFLRKSPESSAAGEFLLRNIGKIQAIQVVWLKNRLLGGFYNVLTFVGAALEAGAVRSNRGAAILAKSSLHAFVTVGGLAGANLHLGSFSLRYCHFLISLLPLERYFSLRTAYLKLKNYEYPIQESII